MSVLAAKAKKAMIIIAPAGCGKSTVTNALAFLYTGKTKIYDSLTRGGLRYTGKELHNFNGLVVIDDLGKVDTQYSRIATITTFAELCYSHFIRKLTMTLNIQVENFYGSALMNIQPSVFDPVVQSPEWEAVIRDKTIRYYHLFRPLQPNLNPINVKLEKGYAVEDVKHVWSKGKLAQILRRVASMQWSRTRVLEHLNDLLKAAAALDYRKEVDVADYRLLYYLMKPMTLERHLIYKSGFEVGQVFNSNAFCVLVELASYRELTEEQIAEDYHVSPSTVDRLLATVPEFCFTKTNSPHLVLPTKYGKEVLWLAGAYE
jgi:energy-coupling factor transporter ATP-binding protein EcfA2